MSWSFRSLARYGTITGAALVGLGLSDSVQAQTLPIAGNPQQANAQERDAIRGVREQDEAAARVSAQLNGGSQGAASGATANNMDELLRAGIVIDARDPNRLNVQRVIPGSPAAMAGLRPGDVITRVNGSPVTSLTAVAQALLSGNTGALGLQVDRNGQSRQLNVSLPDTSARLAARPQTSGQPTAGGNQAPMTVGGAVVPGTGAAATRGNAGITPGLGNITAQGAGGQAVAAGQPAGVGQGTATAPAFSSQAGGTSQPTATTGGTTTAPTTTPFPASAATQGNPTSPGRLVQPNTTSGLPTSTPGVPTSVPGLPTSTPGTSPSPGTGSGGATPSTISSQGTVNPSVGGGTSAISGTSGLTPSAVSSSQGAVNPSIGGGTAGTTATSTTGTSSTGATGAATAGGTSGAAGVGAAGGSAGAGTAGSSTGGAGIGNAGAGGAGAGAGAGGAGAGGT